MAVPHIDTEPGTGAPGESDSPLVRVRASLPRPFRDVVHSGRHLELTDDASLPDASFLPTAVDAVDHLLGGGLPRGRLVELTGKRSCGRFSTLLTTLAAATRSGEVAALIDLGDGLDPRTAEAFGVDLERLLWIRPSDLRTAMISAELALHAGLSLVTIDLGLPPVPGGRGAEAGWLRLARAATRHQTALLVSSPYRVSSTAATTVLSAAEARPLWHRKRREPKLLTGLRGRFSIGKSRLALKVGSETFRFSTSAGRLVSAPVIATQQERSGSEPQGSAVASLPRC